MAFSFCSWCSWTKWERRVKLRFYLFVSGVNQGNEGERWVQDFLVLRTVESRKMAVSALYHAGGSQLNSCWQPIFDSRFTKFEFRSSGAWNFVVLVEDSDIRGPSSITIRMEYVFDFQTWCCEPCVKNPWGGGRKHYFDSFLPFESALVVGGWGLVRWCRKSHLRLSEIASFCSWIFL